MEYLVEEMTSNRPISVRTPEEKVGDGNLKVDLSSAFKYGEVTRNWKKKSASWEAKNGKEMDTLV